MPSPERLDASGSGTLGFRNKDRSTFYVLRSMFYVLCSTFYVLCSTFYVLRSMFYVLLFYVL